MVWIPFLPRVLNQLFFRGCLSLAYRTVAESVSCVLQQRGNVPWLSWTLRSRLELKNCFVKCMRRAVLHQTLQKVQVFHPPLPALESIVQGAPLKKTARQLCWLRTCQELLRVSLTQIAQRIVSIQLCHCNAVAALVISKPSDDQRLVDHLVSTNHSVESTTTSILLYPQTQTQTRPRNCVEEVEDEERERERGKM